MFLHKSVFLITYVNILQRNSNNAFKIFVGGIASSSSEEDLKSYFSAYGVVSDQLDRNESFQT